MLRINSLIPSGGRQCGAVTANKVYLLYTFIYRDVPIDKWKKTFCATVAVEPSPLFPFYSPIVWRSFRIERALTHTELNVQLLVHFSTYDGVRWRWRFVVLARSLWCSGSEREVSFHVRLFSRSQRDWIRPQHRTGPVSLAPRELLHTEVWIVVLSTRPGPTLRMWPKKGPDPQY